MNSGITNSTTELLKKVRRIELKTKGLSSQIFSGEYHSAFKGRGMAFSEVREYMPGDEIRTIDWNVTARLGEPYVKVFQEERELTTILLIDVSASDNFGSTEKLKRNLITEISAVLAFSAIQNNDKVGVIFFSDRVELYIPPKKGKSHILRVIREMIQIKPKSKGTHIAEALTFLNRVQKKRTICFLISDFMDKNDYSSVLKISNKKHDLVAFKIYDHREYDMPNIGLVRFVDPETGAAQWVDTSSKKARLHYAQQAQQQQIQSEQVMRKSGVDFVSIGTHENFVKPIMNLFKRRGK
ncbi:MAG TPA: DUF58 domain-containing protein [Luteibaculaceae bacterium]|nr:DUF58 domain-containing protein [Luteibaculaceae bacterium]